MQCRRCLTQMRLTTKRGDVRYLECGNCGKRARKEASRDPEWLPPSGSFIASLDADRHVAIVPTLTPFAPERRRRPQR